jgi:hypothetical protein
MGTGIGYADGRAWIGSYRLADGTLAFCLQAGKASPVGSETTYVDGESLGWFDAPVRARLAYISREWAPSQDPLTAAAGQLATWRLTGLNSKDPEYYAARAGADAGSVLQRSGEMLQTADREASTAVDAAASISLPAAGAASVRVDLVPARISGDDRALEPGVHTGTATLTGAVFADGSPTAALANGVDVPITPDGAGTTVTVRLEASFDALPYGAELTVARPVADAQNLLVARPATASAAASADRTGVSPKPFRPTVETVTSMETARSGDFVHDRLVASVAPASPDEDVLGEWGSFEIDGVYRPTTLVVESALLGPFSDPIAQADRAPEDAPVACIVETTIDGPGEYLTPDCVLPADGWYTWVEHTLPERTPDEEGGARVVQWWSGFGVAREITHVVPVPPVPPHVELASTGGELPVIPAALAGAFTIVGTGILIRRRRASRS